MGEYIRSKHAEPTKNCGIKIDYKNCASRWSLTHGQLLLLLLLSLLLLLLLLFALIAGCARCCAPTVWSFDQVSAWFCIREYQNECTTPGIRSADMMRCYYCCCYSGELKSQATMIFLLSTQLNTMLFNSSSLYTFYYLRDHTINRCLFFLFINSFCSLMDFRYYPPLL